MAKQAFALKNEDCDSPNPAAGERSSQEPISALQISLMTEIDGLRRQVAFQRDRRNAKTLFKRDDFRIVLIVLKSGARLHEHRTVGRMSLQVLSGLVRVGLPERSYFLPRGQMLALERCLPHDVEAFEESALLLSLSFPKAAVIEECRAKKRHAS